MVALPDVIASNKRIASTLPHGLVAVFVGGTSGVGEYTVKAFAKHAPSPRVYIVGRSQEAADRITKECLQLSPGGHFEFIKADVSLLKNVDDVCRQIKTKVTTINVLFQTQATIAFSKTTSEGLQLASSIVTHSRMRFILNLLPLLQSASSLRRVVSVGAATFEGPIDLDNIAGKDLALHAWRNQGASASTLLLEEAARRAPQVSFIHDMPGLVRGGIMRDAEGFGMTLRIALASLLVPFLQTAPAECGERHLFLATSAMFAPRQGGAAAAGVPLDPKLAVARGSDGRPGSGMYSVGRKGESASPKVEELLAGFREDGTAEKVWNYVAADFKRITGTEAAT